MEHLLVVQVLEQWELLEHLAEAVVVVDKVHQQQRQYLQLVATAEMVAAEAVVVEQVAQELLTVQVAQVVTAAY